MNTNELIHNWIQTIFPNDKRFQEYTCGTFSDDEPYNRYLFIKVPLSLMRQEKGDLSYIVNRNDILCLSKPRKGICVK